MLAAVLAGEGLGRVAEIASGHVGAPVLVVVPRLATGQGADGEHTRYVATRVLGNGATPPPDVVSEVPIVSSDSEIGAVLMLGPGPVDAGDYLHMAAAAALAELAVVEARDQTERHLRGSLLEQVREGTELDGEQVAARAARLGCDLTQGFVALCADTGDRAPGGVLATISSERPGALAQAIGGRVYALVAGGPADLRRLATRLSRSVAVGLSSGHSQVADAGRALEEAELILDVTRSGGGPSSEQAGDGVYRLLFRALASHPEEVRSFYEDTLAPLVRHDEQYSTDLVATVEAYLDKNCNMNATAHAIYAHRHTVSYRLERVRELTGLDPFTSRDRERLGLGLKAHRLIAPGLPR
jgi:PucR C-terminal helix-turn-helix domain/GGDEF-like domain